jgi:hypothetical protein
MLYVMRNGKSSDTGNNDEFDNSKLLYLSDFAGIGFYNK